MSKATKMDNFRTLNLDETTPTKKNVGAVSVNKKKHVQMRKQDNTSRQSVSKVGAGNNGIKIGIFFLVLVIIGACVGCMFTPIFNINTINVLDGEYVSKESILNRLDDVNGQNIWRVNISSFEKSIKEIPYIRSVEIERVLPDTLNVFFKEREPYALVKHMESFVVMDKYGYVLEIKKENDLPDLAIIYGINADEYIVGEKLGDIAGLKYENVTYLLETAYKNNFDYDIYEINYTNTEDLVIAVRDVDVDINFGEIDRNVITEKMSYLNGILKKLAGKKGNLDISSNNYLEKTIFTERY